MEHILGGGHLGWVALKALLLYITAVAAFRISKRRTVAEMSPFDFVAAVAAGAIVGRVPNSDSTSYLAGAVTLATILVVHTLIMLLRNNRKLAFLVDHPPRLLIAHGRILEKELRRSGLTRDDVFGLLRRHQVTGLDQIEFVIYEQRGHISVVRKDADGSDHELVASILQKVQKE